jgi:hypothetical protein
MTPSATSSTTPSTQFNYGIPLNFIMGGGGLGNTQMPEMSNDSGAAADEQS